MTLTLSPSAGTASSVSIGTSLAELSTRIQMRDLLSIHIQTSEPAVTIAVVVSDAARPLLVSDLGWSQEEAAKIRAQLAAFEEDWDAPGMDAYDAL